MKKQKKKKTNIWLGLLVSFYAVILMGASLVTSSQAESSSNDSFLIAWSESVAPGTEYFTPKGVSGKENPCADWDGSCWSEESYPTTSTSQPAENSALGETINPGGGL